MVLWGNLALEKLVGKRLVYPFEKFSYMEDRPHLSVLAKAQATSEARGIVRPYLMAFDSDSTQIANTVYRVIPRVIIPKNGASPAWTINMSVRADEESDESFYLYCKTLLKCL